MSRVLWRGVAALAAVVLASLLVLPLAGLGWVHVTTGSMSPAIASGSAVLVHRVPVAEVQRDDVVAVDSPGGGRVMHRVVERAGQGLRLRGDANAAADPAPYLVDHADRVVLVVPVLGRLGAMPAWAAIATGSGLLLLAAAPARRGCPDGEPRGDAVERRAEQSRWTAS